MYVTLIPELLKWGPKHWEATVLREPMIGYRVRVPGTSSRELKTVPSSPRTPTVEAVCLSIYPFAHMNLNPLFQLWPLFAISSRFCTLTLSRPGLYCGIFLPAAASVFILISTDTASSFLSPLLKPLELCISLFNLYSFCKAHR